MEKDYKADGWLGFIIGAKLFYEFSGKYEYGDKVNELIREVQEAVEGSTDMLVEVPKHVEKLTMEVFIFFYVYNDIRQQNHYAYDFKVSYNNKLIIFFHNSFVYNLHDKTLNNVIILL